MTSLTVNNANTTLDALQEEFVDQEFFSATKKYRLAVYEEWEKDYSPADDDYYNCFTFLIPHGDDLPFETREEANEWIEETRVFLLECVRNSKNTDGIAIVDFF